MSTCRCNVRPCVLCEGTLFNGLHSDQLCSIRGLIVHRQHGPREMLFHEGAAREYLIIIRSGYVKLTTALPDGREQILRIAVGGHLIGFESMERETYPYSAETITESQACSIRFKDMVKVIESDPKVSMQVIRMLNAELDESVAMIRDLGLKNSTERVASFLLSLFPINANGSDTRVRMPLSRREIAEMLGLTIETVSRIMARIRREGLIGEEREYLVVNDRVTLAKMAGMDRPGLQGSAGARYRSGSE